MIVPHALRSRWSLGLAERRGLLVLGDAVAAVLAAVLALWLWALTAREPFATEFLQTRWPWLVVFPAVWLALNLGAYDHARLPEQPADAFRDTLTAAALAFGLYLVLFFLAPRDSLPRLAIFYYLVAAVVFGLAWRLTYARVFSSPYFQKRVLVVGAGWAGREIVAALEQFQAGRYRVVGLIDDDPRKAGHQVHEAPVLGGHASLLPAVQQLGVSEIVLAIHGEIRGATFQALLDCRARGLSIIRMTSLYEQISGRVPLEHLDPDWVVAAYMDQNRIRLLYQLIKRAVDVAAGAAGLLALAALFPLIALAIRLESPGPVLYRQTRLGQGGRPFTLYKFRSMVADAEADGRARWASRDDARITRVGALLRRTRLDEMPQFWNVFLGEMSLVGPRPERPEFTADLEREIPFYRARLIVKPGLTGWAQVNYGYANTVADAALKLQWDLYYLKHRSLWLDFLILWRTVGVMLRLQGT